MATTMTSETVPSWTLGDRLRKARTASNTSAATMAAALGVNRKTISNYEAMRTPITRGNILAWSMLTRCPVEWLLTGEAPSDGPVNGGEQPESATYWYGDGGTHEMGRVAHLQVAA